MKKLLWVAMFALIVASVLINDEREWIDFFPGFFALIAGYIAGRIDERDDKE